MFEIGFLSFEMKWLRLTALSVGLNLIENNKSTYDNLCKCLNTLVVIVSHKLYYKEAAWSTYNPGGQPWTLGRLKKNLQ